MTYISRNQLLDYMTKCVLALRRGTDPNQVADKLEKAVDRASATSYISKEAHNQLIDLVTRRPGITYREAADELGAGWSPQRVRKLATTDHRIGVEVLEHRPGIYGRSPHGLFITGHTYRLKKDGTFALAE